MSATSTRRPSASCPRTVPPVYSLRRERTTKRRGELAELVFQLIATRMGFAVCKPYGDSERYDFILDARQPGPCQSVCHPERGDFCRVEGTERPARKRRAVCDAQNARLGRIRCPRPSLWRVQVKASTHIVGGFYRVHASHRRGNRDIPYQPREIDFIAAYIIPEDTWYIIPIRAVGATHLLFRRKEDRRPSLYAKYKEAWHLLRPKL